jgi:hypothetical protein
MHGSRPHKAVIRLYDAAGKMIETHEHAGDFKEPLFRVKIDWIVRNPAQLAGV